jgi:hypothetical protein
MGDIAFVFLTWFLYMMNIVGSPSRGKTMNVWPAEATLAR